MDERGYAVRGSAYRMARARAETVGGVLRRAREDRGLSREALALKATVTIGTLARLELGQSDPAWSTIVAVADALDLKLSALGALVEDAVSQTTASGFRG